MTYANRERSEHQRPRAGKQVKMIDCSLICQWANVQNQQGIKYYFPTLLKQELFL